MSTHTYVATKDFWYFLGMAAFSLHFHLTNRDAYKVPNAKYYVTLLHIAYPLLYTWILATKAVALCTTGKDKNTHESIY